jgi:hypothetical protein
VSTGSRRKPRECGEDEVAGESCRCVPTAERGRASCLGARLLLTVITQVYLGCSFDRLGSTVAVVVVF